MLEPFPRVTLVSTISLVAGVLLLFEGSILPSLAQENNAQKHVPDQSSNDLPAQVSIVSNSSSCLNKSQSSDTHKDKKSTRQFNGNVSWYGAGFNGKKTASGDIFNMNKLIAAHRNLPFGSRVQVENPKTGASVIVTVKDRGPFVHTRVMDVSREAGRRLGLLLHGVGYMYCLVLEN